MPCSMRTVPRWPPRDQPVNVAIRVQVVQRIATARFRRIDPDIRRYRLEWWRPRTVRTSQVQPNSLLWSRLRRDACGPCILLHSRAAAQDVCLRTESLRRGYLFVSDLAAIASKPAAASIIAMFDKRRQVGKDGHNIPAICQ